MEPLREENTDSRLAPLTNDEEWCRKVLQALQNAQSFALVQSREPFRALNFRGVTAWNEALWELGRAIQPMGWTFNRLLQPTFSAPEDLFPFDVQLFVFHGTRTGSEITTRPRGKNTVDKFQSNARQLAFDFKAEVPTVAPGPLFLCLVMEVTGQDMLRVHLALANGIYETRITCEEIVLLNEEPLPLDAPSHGTQAAPTIAPIEPSIEDLDGPDELEATG